MKRRRNRREGVQEIAPTLEMSLEMSSSSNLDHLLSRCNKRDLLDSLLIQIDKVSLSKQILSIFSNKL